MTAVPSHFARRRHAAPQPAFPPAYAVADDPGVDAGDLPGAPASALLEVLEVLEDAAAEVSAADLAAAGDVAPSFLPAALLESLFPGGAESRFLASR